MRSAWAGSVTGAVAASEARAALELGRVEVAALQIHERADEPEDDHEDRDQRAGGVGAAAEEERDRRDEHGDHANADEPEPARAPELAHASGLPSHRR